jgi:hypothetical protein
MSEQLIKLTSTDLEIAMFVIREENRLPEEHHRFLYDLGRLQSAS